MPDDRFIHRRAGHSARVSLLNDAEHRVWIQYLLSADDFGVMRFSAVTIQADNDHLANRPARTVQRCLEAVRTRGLLQTFEHQGRVYAFQPDWQTFQKVGYPRRTNNPAPPADALVTCDDSTRHLFSFHPGGAGRKKPEYSDDGSGSVPETFSERSTLPRAGAPAKRLTANGERLTATGQRLTAPLHVSHKTHAHCGRVCLHASLFVEFVKRRGHPDADRELRDWALEVERDWGPEGSFASVEPGDSFNFWRARYSERWPTDPAALAAGGLSRTNAATFAAAAELFREEEVKRGKP